MGHGGARLGRPTRTTTKSYAGLGLSSLWTRLKCGELVMGGF